MNLTLTDQLHHILQSLSGFGPETGLMAAFLLIILLDLILTRNKNAQLVRNILLSFSLLSLLAITLLVLPQWQQPSTLLFSGMLLNDALAVFFKLLFLLATFFTLLHTYSLHRNDPSDTPGEFFALLTALLLGLFLMVMSINLLTIYLSIELVSLSSYALTALPGKRKNAEGGIKYLLFGALSSGVMLYGMSLLYGFTGTLEITAPAFAQGLNQIPILPLALAAIFTMGGFLFKLSATPFHVWTPDVYEAAPTPIVALFSVGPKAAALIIFLRFLQAFPLTVGPIVGVFALASILIGNFSALRQSNAKRMLAYSSIAHAGFMLIGLTSLTGLARQSIIFYLTTYLFINLAAFLLIDILAKQSREKDSEKAYEMEGFKGMGIRYPFVGVMVLIVMIALTGLPPTAGFSAKLFIFSALWDAYQTTQNIFFLYLFILGLINSALALFYYLKIPFLLFFRNISVDEEVETEPTLLQKALVGLLVLPVLLFFFKADWLMKMIASL